MDDVADKIFSLGDDISCGDINKDGFLYIALGSALYWKTTGVAHVYHGGPGRSIHQVPDKVFKGEMPMSRFGVNVNLADLNSDDFDDLVAGAWGYKAYQGKGRGQGRVCLYFGGPDK